MNIWQWAVWAVDTDRRRLVKTCCAILLLWPPTGIKARQRAASAPRFRAIVLAPQDRCGLDDFSGLNDADEMTGDRWDDCRRRDHHTRAMLYRRGRIRLLASLGEAIGMSLNRQGDCVGVERDRDGSGRQYARLWRGGEAIDLNGAAASSYAYQVNDHDQAVGWADLDRRINIDSDDAPTVGVIWAGGKMQTLKTLAPYRSSTCTAINNRGHVAGNFTDRAGDTHLFFLRDGKMTVIPDLPNGRLPSVVDLNDEDEVLGRSAVYSMRGKRTYFRSFVWRRRRVTDLSTLGGDCSMEGMNDHGQAVGSSDQSAVLWQRGMLYDLNTLCRKPGADLVEAVSINNRGHILCYGTFFGSQHYFLLIPTEQ